MMDNQLAVFDNKPIRSILHEGEMYYSIVDIIEVLTESSNPRDYWKKVKKRENQLGTICPQLKLQAADGKFYKTDCANTEGVLRIIMSVPSPKIGIRSCVNREFFDPQKRWIHDWTIDVIKVTESIRVILLIRNIQII